jgi:predicted transcriptional regulator of viral defense system
MTLKPGCYFSHYTAVVLNALTEQDPKTMYVNHEQPSSSIPTGELAQERIDSAFQRRPRLSNNIAEVRDLRVCLLNGRNTGRLGVETRPIEVAGQTFQVDVTDLERTLIDIAVRPFYAGGVGEVLKAYELAAPRASANRIAALLKQLAFIYPYHQAIGFYLEASRGYRPEVIERFRSAFSRQFDFYLTYQMRQARYYEKWRLYVPQDL